MKFDKKYEYAVAAALLLDSYDTPIFVRRLKHGRLYVEKVWRGVTLGDRNCPPVCENLDCDVLDEHHCNACLTPTGFIAKMKGERIALRVCSEECLADLCARFCLP